MEIEASTPLNSQDSLELNNVWAVITINCATQYYARKLEDYINTKNESLLGESKSGKILNCISRNESVVVDVFCYRFEIIVKAVTEQLNAGFRRYRRIKGKHIVDTSDIRFVCLDVASTGRIIWNPDWRIYTVASGRGGGRRKHFVAKVATKCCFDIDIMYEDCWRQNYDNFFNIVATAVSKICPNFALVLIHIICDYSRDGKSIFRKMDSADRQVYISDALRKSDCNAALIDNTDLIDWALIAVEIYSTDL